MRTSPELNALAKAMSAAQGEFEGAKKDSVNPHFKSKYADLASAWDACRSILPKHGLSFIQAPEVFDGAVVIKSVLLHESGQWMESELPLYPRDQSIQSFGSAITYGRRYAMMAMLGLAPEDDDGNEASGKVNQTNGNQKQATVIPKATGTLPPKEYTEAEVNLLIESGKKWGWTKESIGKFSVAAYGMQALKLDKEKFQGLTKIVGEMSFARAMASIHMGGGEND